MTEQQVIKYISKNIYDPHRSDQQLYDNLNNDSLEDIIVDIIRNDYKLFTPKVQESIVNIIDPQSTLLWNLMLGTKKQFGDKFKIISQLEDDMLSWRPQIIQYIENPTQYQKFVALQASFEDPDSMTDYFKSKGWSINSEDYNDKETFRFSQLAGI